MSKIKGLYRSYCHDRDADIQEQMTGGETVEELRKFLMQKLNAEDYGIAEELLNQILVETEEKGFSAGCKYISSLNQELLSE
jgi:hypothetical protein